MQPKQSQQSVLTNALIAQKLKDDASKGSAAAAPSQKTTAKKRTTPMSNASARGPAAPTSARSGFTSSSTNKTGGVVKTIVLPHEDINRLGSEA